MIYNNIDRYKQPISAVTSNNFSKASNSRSNKVITGTVYPKVKYPHTEDKPTNVFGGMKLTSKIGFTESVKMIQPKTESNMAIRY